MREQRKEDSKQQRTRNYLASQKKAVCMKGRLPQMREDAGSGHMWKLRHGTLHCRCGIGGKEETSVIQSLLRLHTLTLRHGSFHALQIWRQREEKKLAAVKQQHAAELRELHKLYRQVCHMQQADAQDLHKIKLQALGFIAQLAFDF